jgi:hypothetical protein
VDLEGAGLAASALAGSRFELVAFRDGELQDLDLSGCTFILCDFSGARFRRVNLRKAQFVGCDFDGAVFEEDVDLSDADLTANNLRRCWLGGANLAGARVLHADCRGALGLLANSPLAAKLREGGALLGGSRLGAFWQKVLGHEGTAHKRVLAAVSLTWAITAVAIPLIFFGRAIMNPVNPDNLPEPPQESAEEEPDPAPEESHQD